MSKSGWLWTIFAIIAIIFLWPFSWPDLSKFSFWTTTKEEQMIKNNQLAIDSLKREIKKQEQFRAEYEEQSKLLQDSLAMMRKEFTKDKAKIQQLRHEVQKKKDSVVLLSSDELTKFITDRYRDSIEISR